MDINNVIHLPFVPYHILNHLDLLPGIYVSRKDHVGDNVITTFDLRVTRPNNNLIKISFKSSSFEGSDEGYTLIKELVQLNKFNTFFSEYFIYITKIDVANEVRRLSSFEITWDYLNYYEAICNRGIGRTRTMFEVIQ